MITPKAKKSSNIYLKNKDLLREIIKSKEEEKLTDEAMRMLMLLLDKISSSFSYELEDDKQDCKAFAVLDLLMYWKGFKPEKSSNAFSYYTSIILNGLYKGWNHLHPRKYKDTLKIDKIYSI